MAITIGSNIASLGAQRQLGKATDSLATVFQRLASGQRINKASDDAAGLAIASSLNADTRIFTQAIRNVNDGVSAISITQGALQQLSSIAIRNRELAEQAANGTYSLKQRKAIQDESDAISKEFNRIIQSTSLNGIQLLGSQTSDITLQAGYGNANILSISTNGALKQNVGDGTFANAVSYSTSGGQYPILTGDFNSDGIIDIISGASGGSSTIVTLMLGNGDGSFGTVTTFSIKSSNMNIGDFNGDGKLDIITANSSVSLYLGNGNGTFQSAISSSFDANATEFSYVSDLDGDGNLDFIGNGLTNQIIAVSLGKGDGSFKAVQSLTTSAIDQWNVRTADLNNDGKKEILVTDTHGVVVIGLNSDGSLKQQSVVTAGASITSLETGDYNRDGFADLAIFDNGSSNYFIRLGNGDGTFRATVTYSQGAGVGANQSAQTDLNGDGYLDFILSDLSGSGALRTVLGNGDGTFNAAITVNMLSIPAKVAVGDFNRDGAQDFVATGSAATGNQVYIANTTKSTSEQALYLLSAEGARAALKTTEQTLARIASTTAQLGSYESRLEIASNALKVSRENYQSAQSRIMDADIAEETSVLMRSQILQQVGSAVLSQANLLPNLALKLLRE